MASLGSSMRRKPQPPFAKIGHLDNLPTVLSVHPRFPRRMYVDGPFDTDLITNAATKYICKCCHTSRTDIEPAIRRFLEVTHRDYLSWTTSNPSNPVGAFLFVRVLGQLPESDGHFKSTWHVDPKPYTPENKEEPFGFYAVTLHGSPTIILKESLFTRTFRSARGWEYMAENGGISDDPLDIPTQTGDIIRFTAGKPGPPVHAAGDRSNHRVFLRICYGSETQIRESCESRCGKYGQYGTYHKR